MIHSHTHTHTHIHNTHTQHTYTHIYTTHTHICDLNRTDVVHQSFSHIFYISPFANITLEIK